MAALTLTITDIDDEGVEIEVVIPAKHEVCNRCEGRGTHVNPAIDGHGITSEEWWGPDWDDDSREMYMTGGYDVPCYECGGKRVVLTPDEERCTPAQSHAYEVHMDAEAEYQEMVEAERKMGA